MYHQQSRNMPCPMVRFYVSYEQITMPTSLHTRLKVNECNSFLSFRSSTYTLTLDSAEVKALTKHFDVLTTKPQQNDNPPLSLCPNIRLAMASDAPFECATCSNPACRKCTRCKTSVYYGKERQTQDWTKPKFASWVMKLERRSNVSPSSFVRHTSTSARIHGTQLSTRS